MRTAINAFPRQPGMPRVLLTTFPNEQHGVGLLMVEAMLVPEGVQCISLGHADAARGHPARGRSRTRSTSSRCRSPAPFRLRQATDGLASLRRQIPPQVTIWAGGEMTRRVRKTMPGIVLLPDLGSAVNALRSWRSHWIPPAAAATDSRRRRPSGAPTT